MSEVETAQAKRKRPTGAQIVLATAVLSALLSVASWTYRTLLEFSPYQKIWFYILFPATFWALFAGLLFLTRNSRKYVRILAGILLVPASLLWILSVIIGFFGLRIH